MKTIWLNITWIKPSQVDSSSMVDVKSQKSDLKTYQNHQLLRKITYETKKKKHPIFVGAAVTPQLTSGFSAVQGTFLKLPRHLIQHSLALLTLSLGTCDFLPGLEAEASQGLKIDSFRWYFKIAFT